MSPQKIGWESKTTVVCMVVCIVAVVMQQLYWAVVGCFTLF